MIFLGDEKLETNVGDDHDEGASNKTEQEPQRAVKGIEGTVLDLLDMLRVRMDSITRENTKISVPAARSARISVLIKCRAYGWAYEKL